MRDALAGAPVALGQAAREPAAGPLPGADRWTCAAVDDGYELRFAPGTLDGGVLTCDALLEGEQTATFLLALQEGAGGPAFTVSFGLLCRCQARLAIPIAALAANCLPWIRRGAWVKTIARGRAVDPARVDRLRLTLLRIGDQPVRWCQTPWRLVADEPAPLEEPLLVGADHLVDRFGQSAIRDWPTRTRDEHELLDRLHRQHEEAADARWPARFGRWGGDRARRREASGFFRTARDEDGRWELVDPDGHPFFSAGCVSVRPDPVAIVTGLERACEWLPGEDGPFGGAHRFMRPPGQRSFDFLVANLVRAFGARTWYDRWADLALAQLARCGFNTVANWSDWWLAAEEGLPYVRSLEPRFPRTPTIVRGLADPWHPAFADDAAALAATLADTRDDPALIGWFLMNEPKIGFAPDPPGVLALRKPACVHAREELARRLRERYPTDDALAAAWGASWRFERVVAGDPAAEVGERARADCEAFGTHAVRTFFTRLDAACRRVDPHHLDLGARFQTVPPDWVLAGCGDVFDVFSFNCYDDRPAEKLARLGAAVDRPTLVGEWHFGATDAGLCNAGVCRVASQRDRGRAYRRYLADCVADRHCVGAHWFTLYDQSVLGRVDGECYNLGVCDICHRPYAELVDAMRAAHERLYDAPAAIAGDEPARHLPRHCF